MNDILMPTFRFAERVYVTAAKFLAQKGLEKYRGISERDFDALNILNALQSLYKGAKASRSLDDNMMKEFEAIINAFIEALKIYASRLELRTPTKYNPVNEYKTLSEETLKSTTATGAHPPSNIDEKLIYETQVLAVIALLCAEYPNIAQMLLFEKCEAQATDGDDNDYADGANRIGSFVDILTDVLCAIGHSVSHELTRKNLIKFSSQIVSFYWILANRKRCHHTMVSSNRRRCCLSPWPKVSARPM